jgi:Mg2+/Co2+ transporter CorC
MVMEGLTFTVLRADSRRVHLLEVIVPDHVQA